jgi:hypothetical protein
MLLCKCTHQARVSADSEQGTTGYLFTSFSQNFGSYYDCADVMTHKKRLPEQPWFVSPIKP